MQKAGWGPGTLLRLLWHQRRREPSLPPNLKIEADPRDPGGVRLEFRARRGEGWCSFTISADDVGEVVRVLQREAVTARRYLHSAASRWFPPVPRVTGLRVEEASRLLTQLGLRLEVTGPAASEASVIVRQWPPEGLPLKVGHAVRVEVRNPD